MNIKTALLILAVGILGIVITDYVGNRQLAHIDEIMKNTDREFTISLNSQHVKIRIYLVILFFMTAVVSCIILFCHYFKIMKQPVIYAVGILGILFRGTIGDVLLRNFVLDAGRFEYFLGNPGDSPFYKIKLILVIAFLLMIFITGVISLARSKTGGQKETHALPKASGLLR
ncbi:MAG: hypothetical protein KAS23_10480 [Anaerohalosphaera sp.]|nr:hypothetical protein [Anaerohalosphaera sp.]